MDFKLNRENLTCSAVILDTDVTQAAEYDFILPDYCPDIFRVLKCCIIPGIVSTGINGNRLTFELAVTIRVIYRSDEGSAVSCIEQSLDYSKTVDLPSDTLNPAVTVTPDVEYVNCRVVNQRRLDVKGNINCKVRVTGEKNCEVVSDAFGGGIQLKKIPVVFPAKRVTAAKRITVIEELELAAGKAPLGSIIRCCAAVKCGEQKIIPGKLVTKGNADIDLLYLPKDSSDKPPEAMKFSIPFSQIIDIDGIEEGYDTDVSITAAKCTITAKPDESDTLECELIMLVNITAMRFDTCELVTDAYSTKYECECEKLDVSPMSEPLKIRQSLSLGTSLSCSDGEITQVYDLWCENPTASCRYDDVKEKLIVYGKAMFCMLGRLSDGTAAYSEKECAYEQELEADCSGYGKNTFIPEIRITGCSYTMGEDGTVQAKAEAEILGNIRRDMTAALLGSVRLCTDKPKSCDKRCAVKICYSDTEEDIWSIAKKYSTSAQAIREENDFDDNNGRRVLIIPMKN